jgi:hypothetical protein
MLADLTGLRERHRRGFILIEVLVSIALLAATVSGVVATISTISRIRLNMTKQAGIACSTPDCRRESNFTRCTCGKKTWLILP